jgi:hypothetical protein
MIQTNAQKLEIFMKIDVYSHRRLHRRACCSSGTLQGHWGPNVQHTVAKVSENDVETLH